MDNTRNIIIIVDDDITNLTVARHNLVGKYDVVTAPSGEKLFRILEKITPALILLDIEMPEMNGYEILKILKREEKTAHIPVIFLTATINPESKIQCLSLGAADCIKKPFSRDLLVERVGLHIQLEKQKKEDSSMKSLEQHKV